MTMTKTTKKVLTLIQAMDKVQKFKETHAESLKKYNISTNSLKITRFMNLFIQGTEPHLVLGIDYKNGFLNASNNLLFGLIDNMSGAESNVLYNIKERKFISEIHNNQPFCYSLKDLLNSKTFFKEQKTWLENGITNEDIEFASDLACHLIDYQIFVCVNENKTVDAFERQMFL